MTTYPIAGRELEIKIRPSRRFKAFREDDDGDRNHGGIDIEAHTGQVVVAPVAGKVAPASWTKHSRAIVVTGESETWLIAPARNTTTGEVEEGDAIGFITSYNPPKLQGHAHVQFWDRRYVPPLPRALTSWPIGDPRPEGLKDPTLRLRVASPKQVKTAGGGLIVIGAIALWLYHRRRRRR